MAYSLRVMMINGCSIHIEQNIGSNMEQEIARYMEYRYTCCISIQGVVIYAIVVNDDLL